MTYFEPSDKRLSRSYKRNRFLDALEEFAPTVRSDLISRSLPLCQDSRNESGFRRNVSSAIEGILRSERVDNAAFTMLVNEVKSWQSQWHLLDDWIFAAAFKTIVQTMDFPDLAHLTGWAYPGEVFLPPESGKTGSFEIHAWSPVGRLSRAEYEKKMIDRFRIVLKDVNEQNISEYRKAGWIKVREAIPAYHYEWLVDFQIHALGPRKIAKKNLGITKKTTGNQDELNDETEKVKKAIERLAVSIGLTRRLLRQKSRD